MEATPVVSKQKLAHKQFDNGLMVKHRKHAIIFTHGDAPKDGAEDRFIYAFSDVDLEHLITHLETAANEAWNNFAPKEADSIGSDYDEYYDRRYDNNGYLQIRSHGIDVSAPYGSTDTLYQFNKAKAQSFLYDLRKHQADRRAQYGADGSGIKTERR